jgi:hypothetical protein
MKPRKHDDPSSAIEHFHQVVGLAKRLQPLGIAIYQHNWLCLIAGSWSLVAGIRRQSYRFAWDGREGFISVFGPFHVVHGDAEHAPHIKTEGLVLDSAVDPLSYVETFFEQNHAA